MRTLALSAHLAKGLSSTSALGVVWIPLKATTAGALVAVHVSARDGSLGYGEADASPAIR